MILLALKAGANWNTVVKAPSGEEISDTNREWEDVP